MNQLFQNEPQLANQRPSSNKLDCLRCNINFAMDLTHLYSSHAIPSRYVVCMTLNDVILMKTCKFCLISFSVCVKNFSSGEMFSWEMRNCHAEKKLLLFVVMQNFVIDTIGRFGTTRTGFKGTITR